MGDPPDAGWWRAESLRQWSAGSDAAVDDALTHGVLHIEPTGATWEASHGTVRALRVVVRLDAELLARVTHGPSPREELVRALSMGLAERPHDALADVDLAWDGTLRRESGYRGAARTAATPEEGIRAFLRARGVTATVTVSARGARGEAHAQEPLDADARDAVADAARWIIGVTRLTWT